MIVWLSSYPKAGNAVVRTMLRHCFGRNSYFDEPLPKYSDNIELRLNESHLGHKELPIPWTEFYAQAIASPEVIFIKTHRAPIDSHPFIYIVRDGRAALQSYKHHYDNFFPDEHKTLLQLIVGNDAYGDWSRHFRAWNCRPDIPRLLLRYEELKTAPERSLEKLSDFIKHKGPKAEWRDPFLEHHAIAPKIFRSGRADFVPEAIWTETTLAFFYHLHGRLMDELGYDSIDISGVVPIDISAIAALVSTLIGKSNSLAFLLEEKERALQSLLKCRVNTKKD